MKHKTYKYKYGDKVRVVAGDPPDTVIPPGTFYESMSGWTGMIHGIEVFNYGLWDYLVCFDTDTLQKMSKIYITKRAEGGYLYDRHYFNEYDLELVESNDYEHTGVFIP